MPKLIATGLSAKIAPALFVSNATVKTRTGRIIDKTGARDRSPAVPYAYQHDLT